MSSFNSTSAEKRHSEDFFGEQRDYWWNRDFLDLMAARWKLHAAQSLADIGCGVGHWARLLAPYLSAKASITGVDREEEWLHQASLSFRREHPALAFTPVQADAESLPLPTGHFDVVTCQTVLMHLAKPWATLQEMVRIAKPGGLILAVEPNNFLNRMVFDSLTWTNSNDELLSKLAFWVCYHRGKSLNQEGDDTIGDVLPGQFARLGLEEIQVFCNDKAAPMFPPYTSKEQQVMLNQEDEWLSNNTGTWNLPELRRRVLAGGGSDELCDRYIALMLREAEMTKNAIKESAFCASNGTLTYLVSARKPNG